MVILKYINVEINMKVSLTKTIFLLDTSIVIFTFNLTLRCVVICSDTYKIIDQVCRPE
jgi:hypothetical protein